LISFFFLFFSFKWLIEEATPTSARVNPNKHQRRLGSACPLFFFGLAMVRPAGAARAGVGVNPSLHVLLSAVRAAMGNGYYVPYFACKSDLNVNLGCGSEFGAPAYGGKLRMPGVRAALRLARRGH